MSHPAREPKPIDRIQQVWASVVNKYAAELIPERLRNGVLMVSGPHEVISALSEFSRRQLVERINQELGGKVVNGVQFHPVRLACITAYSQQLPKREILFLREPFKIERLGGRHYMQISDHLHYLVQHVGADGKFDHNEGAWPIAKDRRSRAVRCSE
ncbi:MAG: DciA family protein [Rhodopila sp.]|jgi:Dna[CI] antecedent, DciA